jgi:hypothetical protein
MSKLESIELFVQKKIFVLETDIKHLKELLGTTNTRKYYIEKIDLYTAKLNAYKEIFRELNKK